MMLLGVLALLPAIHAKNWMSDETLEAARARLEHKLEMLGGDHAWSESTSKRLLEQAMMNTDNNPDETDWFEKHEDFVKEDGVTYTQSEYLTPRFSIESGGAHFTLNPFYHIKLPKGDYVMTNAHWDIVDGTGGIQIPLTELYNHHFLIGTASSPDPLGMCEEDLFWGGGAEYRRMDYTNPGGYGIARIGASGVCGANLHFIRVDDLKTSWEGLNDPKGDHGAAVKNCAECGYAPGRAPECLEWLDGSFGCCFSGSRCPVINPHNRTKKEYRMKYTLEWTKNMSMHKNIRIHCLDLGGAPRIEKQNFLFGTEWNTGPYLNNEGAHQHCNATVCNITNSVVVGEQKSLENGMCPGEMIWSYVHMHGGAITGSMYINGKKYCTSNPVVGTDANNTPGNEKGFMVEISNCVNDHKFGNRVRLNAGDVVTVNAFYDVDAASTTYLPFPGGKHGGIMALFFSAIHCDPGTWGEVYVCRQNTCIGVRKKLSPFEKKYKTISDCEQKCSGTVTSMQQGLPAPVVHSKSNPPVAPVGLEGIGRVQVRWRDCAEGKALAKVDHYSPSSFPLHGKTKLGGSVIVPKDIEGGNFTLKLMAGVLGLTLVDISGSICEKKSAVTMLGLMQIAWDGVDCPVKAGNQSISVTLTLSALIPKIIAETTTTVVATALTGEQMFCAEVVTEGKSKLPVLV
jgi:hypothetical protein